MPACQVTNLVIGNNAVAVAAAAQAAGLGYDATSSSAATSEGPAEDLGRELAETALRMHREAGPDCLVSGGEPVVRLVEPARRGKGGRNQQLVLAAVTRLESEIPVGILILSGGTDGEDGPTDAAGAFADAAVIGRSGRLQLDAQRILRARRRLSLVRAARRAREDRADTHQRLRRASRACQPRTMTRQCCAKK